MKMIIDQVKKEGSLVFTDKEIEVLKNNNNCFTIRSEDLPHFKNTLFNMIVQLTKITENVQSFGDEEISSKEVTKK